MFPINEKHNLSLHRVGMQPSQQAWLTCLIANNHYGIDDYNTHKSDSNYCTESHNYGDGRIRRVDKNNMSNINHHVHLYAGSK